MPEARDRLERPVSELYNRHRTSIGSIGILPGNDDSGRSMNLTPFRWHGKPLTGGGSGQRIGEAVTTTTRGQALFETPMPPYRRGGRSQNTSPLGNSFRRGRGRRHRPRSVLPAWYPRTPLGDITHVVWAIERRRRRLGEGAGPILGTRTPRRMYQQPADQHPSSSDAQLDHDASFGTPKPKLGSVPLILTAIVNQCEKESELQTPQKKLLNSNEIVQKVVMEELKRLKQTPTAKKAEREKRVRILMSMR